MKPSINSLPYDPETYEPLHPAHELEAARYSPLTAFPASSVAVSACQSLLDELSAGMDGKVTGKQLKALGAVAADLLERDPDDEGGWLYRSMNAASFTGAPIGQRPFMKVYSAMTGDMIEEVRGNRLWGESQIAKSGKLPVWQRATRFRPTPALRQWFASQGITRGNWEEHFTRDPSPPMLSKGTCSVILRSGKPPRHFRVSKGYRVPLDLSEPKVAAMVARMDRLNDYLSKATVTPHGPVVLRRIFAHGDDPGHGWRQGGRLYAVGASPYQTAKRERRSAITIDGKATCELDIQASHLTILAGLGHVPPFEGDPYEMSWPERPVVKRWVNMTLSHGKRHSRWPKATVDDLLKADGINLKTDYPLEKTGDAILRHLPILKEDGSSSVAVGWGELQFRESEVVLAGMEVLAFEHDVPALPVHDSLIVPEDAEAVAEAVLRKTFRDAVGVDPVIK
jgi:hypothetical protein